MMMTRYHFRRGFFWQQSVLVVVPPAAVHAFLALCAVLRVFDRGGRCTACVRQLPPREAFIKSKRSVRRETDIPAQQLVERMSLCVQVVSSLPARSPRLAAVLHLRRYLMLLPDPAPRIAFASALFFFLFLLSSILPPGEFISRTDLFRLLFDPQILRVHQPASEHVVVLPPAAAAAVGGHGGTQRAGHQGEEAQPRSAGAAPQAMYAPRSLSV